MKIDESKSYEQVKREFSAGICQPKIGQGDYTRERRKWLRDQSVQTVAARIRARKKARA